jgi:methyl-accepting chemotaxis protein
MTSQAESSPPKRKRGNRRRQLIVDKPFQFRLIGLLLAIWAANSLFFSIILYYFYQGHILRFYDLIPRPGMVPLLQAPVLFTVAIGFIMLFGMVLVGIIGVYLSNQIAGPLYRVKLSLKRVTEGDVNFEIRFRDRDFLEDFPGYFNRMLESLKERGNADLEVLKALEASLNDPNKSKSLIRELRERKEAQLGLVSDSPDQVSVAVH